jgi:hypothetical protein
MAEMNPFENDPSPTDTRLPWMSLFIIVMITIVVGWMVFTATPSVARPAGDVSPAVPERTVVAL